MTRRSAPLRQTALVAALCAAAAFAGFALGRASAPPPPAPAPAELAASIRAALTQGDTFERLRRSTELLEQLAPDNLVEVAAVYEQMRPLIHEWDSRAFLAAWARFDPSDAFDRALEWSGTEKRRAGAGVALEAWASFDPERAREAFVEAIQEHRGLRGSLVRSLVTGWVRSGQALDRLNRFIAGSRKRDEAIQAVIRELMRSGGPEAVRAWADPILADATQPPQFKEALFHKTLRQLLRWDPEAAAAWVAPRVEEDYAERGPSIVAGQWAGPAVMAWLRGLPAGEPRDRGVHNGFKIWFRRDPAAATAWLLDSGSPQAFQAPALEAYAEERVGEAPEEALGWCERIADPERARGCLQNVASRWHGEDPEAAEAWLQQSTLDEAARGKVRKSRWRAGPPSRRPRAGLH